MALVKARGTKRPSATSSYSAASSIVAFVGLSVLGLWLILTFHSFAPSQQPTAPAKTEKTPTRLSSIGHTHHHSSALPQTRQNEPEIKVENGEEAVIEPERKVQNDEVAVIEPETKVENHEAAVIEPEAKVESNEEAVIEPDTKIENDETQTGDQVDHQDTKESRDNSDAVEEQEKQAALENQTSEESSMTQKEEIIQGNQRSETKIEADDGNHGAEDVSAEGGSESQGSNTAGNEITDEDQQRRIDEDQQGEEQQKQQEGKEAKSTDPNGATSHAQTQHDEAPIHLHQDGSSSEETDKPKAQTTSEEVKHDSLDEDTGKVKPVSEKMNEETSNKNNEASTTSEDSIEIPKESTESKNSWTTQANQSENQKERRNGGPNGKDNSNHGYTWLLCNVTEGADYIPCLDNEKVVANIHSRAHHEHRERHCPTNAPTCLVPLPKGYKKRIDWPQSRDKIWYNNIPHTSLAEYKGHQNWVKVTGEFLTFPGGGTQFIYGALHYIDFIQEAVPDIAWGKHSHVVLDVGCGVASFGGYLFDRDVLTMSFAPKDEHEAQVQFALERGIPAISAVMGSQRLPFPSRVFDVVHCARCRVPWHVDGGSLLLELNRVLRPGGYFVWSATPVYQKLEEDVQIWKEMSRLTVSMCWELVTIKKDKINSIGAAIYQKPDSNDCYNRRKQKEPLMCKTDDDPNAAWYIPLQSCMHQIPTQENERGSQWPEEWPERLQTPPYWLNKSKMGIYGKPAPDDFVSDYEHWQKVVSTVYMNDLGIKWSEVRNVMDLRAVYGGFAAALKDQNLWVLNVVNVDSPDTLPIIYERGLFGIYHDWCESFSSYPRTYDLLHADHLFSNLKKRPRILNDGVISRCKLEFAMAEIDRLLRPGGKLIMRDESSTVAEVVDFLKSLHWEVFLNHSKNQEGILSAKKSDWRPTSFADSS
ncbi:probable methyltransferase PMT27 [Salvia splendens]|uniref:probable methyltransferase PMT27 n=1 Tax=Salvia splendens TaxID=180675 RepID=UPI001C26AE92|nr:probable methyltransferase PMT27 [Salvia splendens]